MIMTMLTKSKESKIRPVMTAMSSRVMIFVILHNDFYREWLFDVIIENLPAHILSQILRSNFSKLIENVLDKKMIIAREISLNKDTIYRIHNQESSWWARFRFSISETLIYHDSNPSRLHSYVESEQRKGISIQRRSNDTPSDAARILQEIISCVGRISNAWHHNCFLRKFGPDRPRWDLNGKIRIYKKIMIHRDLTNLRLVSRVFWINLIMMKYELRQQLTAATPRARAGQLDSSVNWPTSVIISSCQPEEQAQASEASEACLSYAYRSPQTIYWEGERFEFLLF